MARKPRDYRAEEARRNERARAAGFATRAEERKIRQKSAKWSRESAEKAVAFYHPKWSASKVRAYYDAYVDPKTNFGLGKGVHNPHTFRWLVTETGYMTANEYHERYHLK